MLRQNYGSNVALLPIVIYSRMLSLLYLYKCIRSSRERRNSQTHGGIRDLVKVILDEKAFSNLKTSMVEDLCLENALYLQDLIHAHKSCKVTLNLVSHQEYNVSGRSLVPAEQIHDCVSFVKVIYQKFVHPQSPYELNISHDLRSSYGKKILG